VAWYIPLAIFAARVCDVSIGTVRTILVVSGHRWIPAMLGAVEVCIWVLAVAGVMRHLSDPRAMLGYAAGFATGVIVGSFIEDRLAIGYRLVRVVTTRANEAVSSRLREHGYAVTQVDGFGRDGPVEIAFLLIRRRELRGVRELIDRLSPHCFVTVDRAGPPTRGTVPYALGTDLWQWLGVRK
jgi:uncharacterized protein YebE (UPF0316 family)